MATKHISGIYAIEQIGTDRFYIGSSKAIHERWSQHRRLLRIGTHHARFLQNAWNKHGEEAFRFYVLDQCEQELLLEKEQMYMDAFKPVFNTVPFAKAIARLSPEARAKAVASLRARAAKITHCPAGHEYNAENTAFSKDGGRLCRMCNKERVSKVYAAETADEHEARMRRLADYYERTKEAQQPARQAYVQAHKPEKSQYDKSRRPLANQLRNQRRATMSPAEREAYLEAKRRQNGNRKEKAAEYQRSRAAINNARRNERRAAMSPERRAEVKEQKRLAHLRRKARLNGHNRARANRVQGAGQI